MDTISWPPGGSDSRDTRVRLAHASRSLKLAAPDTAWSPPAAAPPCLVFLHIPKAGGETVREFLKGVANAVGFTSLELYSKEFTDPAALRPKGMFMVGHVTPALFERNREMAQCHKLTLIREPVDRAISAFFYHKHKYPDEIDRCLPAGGNTTSGTRHAPAASYLRSISHRHHHHHSQEAHTCWLAWQYADDMTRQLAGLSDTKWNTYLEDEYTGPPVTRTHLKRAKHNLVKYFDEVCIMQEMQTCLSRLLETFHIGPSSPQYMDLNHSSLKFNHMNKWKTHGRPDKLDDATMEKFKQANGLDIELYDWIMSRS